MILRKYILQNKNNYEKSGIVYLILISILVEDS